MKGEKWFNGKYLQGSLSDKSCQALLNLIEGVEEIEGLKHCIQNLPSHLVQDIINDYENYEKEHGTMVGFKKSYKPVIGELRPAQTVGVAFMYFAKYQPSNR